MTERRLAAVFAGAAAFLLAAAAAPAQVALDDLELMPLVAYALAPGINPPNLAENIAGFTDALTEMGAYDRKVRARGMNAKREERLAVFERSFDQDREILTMYIAWLQDAVERAPAPGSGLKEDDVEYDIVEKSSKLLTGRKPVASDFYKRKRELPEHERGQDAQLKPGELEFRSDKP